MSIRSLICRVFEHDWSNFPPETLTIEQTAPCVCRRCGAVIGTWRVECWTTQAPPDAIFGAAQRPGRTTHHAQYVRLEVQGGGWTYPLPARLQMPDVPPPRIFTGKTQRLT